MLISTMSSPSIYTDFETAAMTPDQEFTVIGQLIKSKQITYNPKHDPNLVKFFMMDKKGKEFEVLLNQSKPQDMERSEDIVVKGKVKGDVFQAHTILLKCPSKYEEKSSPELIEG
jgi:cytochrome c-type biogenesis protein CcmE